MYHTTTRKFSKRVLCRTWVVLIALENELKTELPEACGM